MEQNTTVNNEKEMEKIVNELKSLKVKSDRKELQKKTVYELTTCLTNTKIKKCQNFFGGNLSKK